MKKLFWSVVLLTLAVPQILAGEPLKVELTRFRGHLTM
jgi:hypothetical protein